MSLCLLHLLFRGGRGVLDFLFGAGIVDVLPPLLDVGGFSTDSSVPFVAVDVVAVDVVGVGVVAGAAAALCGRSGSRCTSEESL